MVLTQRTGVRRVRANCPRHSEPCFYFAVCGRRARHGDRQRLQSSLCYLRVFDCAEDHIGMVKGRLQSRRRWGEMRKRLWRDCQSRQTRSDRFRFAS